MQLIFVVCNGHLLQWISIRPQVLFLSSILKEPKMKILIGYHLHPQETAAMLLSQYMTGWYLSSLVSKTEKKVRTENKGLKAISYI